MQLRPPLSTPARVVRPAPDPHPPRTHPIEELVITPGTRPVVHREDAERADLVLGALDGRVSSALELRGLLIQAFADCRTESYNDGYDDHKNGLGE
jgi:hypothetical protein